MFTALRVVLQFIDRRHGIWERLRARAVNVWQRFSIWTLGEYNDLYLKIDVLLLADVFENFRNSCVESYELDPAYYYTLPGFTWDDMLKHTSVKFELIADIDMIMFIERDIRDGLSQSSNKYALANNKYMPSYDPSKSWFTMTSTICMTGQCVALCRFLMARCTKFWFYDHCIQFNRLFSRSERGVPATSSWRAHWSTVLSDLREKLNRQVRWQVPWNIMRQAGLCHTFP